MVYIQYKWEKKLHHSAENALNITNWFVADVKCISPLRPIQSKVSHPPLFITPSSPSLCPFGCPTFHSERVRGIEQDSCQTRPPWVKMAGEVLFFFLYLSFLLSGFKPPPFTKFCDAILSEQRKERNKQALFSGRLGSSWLMLLPRRGMTMKGPPTPTAIPMAFTFPVSV